MTKTCVVTGGGTAGHIYPALALAEELEQRGWKVYYAGTANGIEHELAPDAGIEFKAFEASGFDRARPMSLFSGVARIMEGTKHARQWFSEIKPNAVVGFGGYVSIPVSRAAEKTGVPVVIHEQNSVMGMANSYLSRKAAAVCLTYEAAANGVSGQGKKRIVLTGNPVRAAVATASKSEGREMLGVPEDAVMLLVFGGSRGARHINEAVASLKDELLAIPDLYVVHITGPSELERVQESLALTPDESKRYLVMGYQKRMPETLAAADAIVSRAGATSLAEIAARSIPAILVPYPYARSDHQTFNAASHAGSGAAIVIPDEEIDGDEFKESVLAIAGDEDFRSAMREHASSKGVQNAAASLADQVERAASGAALE